jgi:HK97 family phage portal protein
MKLTQRRQALTAMKRQPVNQALTISGRDVEYSRVFYTGKTKAGVRITPDNAITISAVWACIRFLSQSIAALPWDVIDDRTKTPVSLSVPAQAVLQRPSDEYSSLQFRETLMHWVLRWGNGYAEIERDVLGRPLAMHPIHPERVCVMRDPVTYEIYYTVDMTGGRAPVVLEFMDIFHLRGMGESVVGMNVIAYAAQSLGWAKAVQMFGASFFGEGATPAGVVMMKKPLTPDGLAALKKEFQRVYSGAANAGKTAFLDNDMEYKPLTVDPDKGQFIETNQFLIDEVCRWFGVPPHKIYKLLNATFSNIEHQSIEVVTDSLRPWSHRFEDEAKFKLLGNNRAGYSNKINLKGLLTGDTKTRLEWYRGLREIGVLNANDILRLEDMPLISEDDGGEKRVMQSQYTTMDKIGEVPAPVDGSAPAAPSTEPDPAQENDPVTPETDQSATDEVRRRAGAAARAALMLDMGVSFYG